MARLPLVVLADVDDDRIIRHLGHGDLWCLAHDTILTRGKRRALPSRLLQQSRHPSVGQRLATGLARRAVRQGGRGGAHLEPRVTALRALLTRAAVDRHALALGFLDLRRTV